MKTAVDHFWSLTCLGFLLNLLTLANGIPINRQVGISENVFITVQNDTYGNEQRVCSIDSLNFADGDTIPTSSPCEHCICRPPGFACTIISCDYRPGCKAFKRSNQCCPEYQCECEKDGRIYQNGEKIMDSNNPCEICYCQGGEIVCAIIDCYWRSDCQPRYVDSRCCPLYDHCPPPSTGPFMRPTIPTTTTASSFPWFNFSNAVYEIPEKSTPPTPLPVFLTSRSTEATTAISTTTQVTTTASSPLPANSEPELVVIATEKVPVEVNIMTAAEEHEEPAIFPEPESTQEAEPSANVQVSEVGLTPNIEPSASSSLLEENATPIVLEPSVVVNVPEKILSTPSLEPSAVITDEHESSSVQVSYPSEVEVVNNSEMSQSTPNIPIHDSTTVFFAPAIAISIIPSPVEQILVTQEALTPEIASQIFEYDQNETVAPSEVSLDNEVPESIVANVIAPSIESLPSQISSNQEHSTTLPELQPEIVSTEVPTEISKPELSHSSIETNQDDATVEVTSTNLEAEVTTLSSVVHSEHNDEAMEGVALVEEFTKPQEQQTTTPSSVLKNTFNKESIEPEATVVTVTPSSEDLQNVPVHDEALQVVSNNQNNVPQTTAAAHAAEEIIAEENSTTVSSVLSDDRIVPVQDDTVSIFAGDDFIVEAEAEEINVPVTTLSTLAVKGHEVVDVKVSNIQNTETEIATESITQETTEIPFADEEAVVPTTSSPQVPAIEQDQPEHILNDQQLAIEENFGVVLSTESNTEGVQTTTANSSSQDESQFDDVIHISADEGLPNFEQNEIQKDDTVVIAQDEAIKPQVQNQKTEQKPETNLQVNPLQNEINEIGPNTFEIIPPQVNEIENLPEIQNQMMEKLPTDKNPEFPSSNEVDSPPEKNKDDDTVEIFAIHSASGESDADTHVIPETTITTKNVEPEEKAQADSASITTTPSEDPVESLDDDTDSELMHTDDQHGNQDETTIKSTEVSVEAIVNDDVALTTPSHFDDSENAQMNDQVDFSGTTPKPIQVKQEYEDVVQDDTFSDHVQTTESPSAQNDEVESPTTANPVIMKKVEESNSDKYLSPISKFRLDLDEFEGSGSHEVQSTGTPGEVVFDEVQPAPTVEEPIVRDESSNPVESTTIIDKLRNENVDFTTTQKYRHDMDTQDIQPIQNFEFDDVFPSPTTVNSIYSDDVESLNVEVTTVSSVPQENNLNNSNDAPNSLRNEQIEETTVSNSPQEKVTAEESYSDFVQVSTFAPSGFGAEFREEFSTISPSYKSDIILEDVPATTVESIVFDEAVTTHEPSSEKGKAEPFDETTTVESPQDDEAVHDDVTTIFSILNDTSTPRIISLDQMMIPEKGVSAPAVADDITKPKNGLSRSDIVQLEGENDSWLVQTAFKNRQLQGLFPYSRSHKRLFRTRQPRETVSTSSASSGSHFSKTYFKKTKKAPSSQISSTEKPRF